jgi:signal transduction histidine kinase
LLFSDSYFKINNPESFMCVPVILKEKVIGAVYLENSALAGVFSPERVAVVASIINQTAAVFQNAIYYGELNNYAKTVETRLKEHSNLLNSMIAGIAHEINTPVGVCVTVVSHMSTLTKKTVLKFEEQKLSKSELKNYFDEINKGAHIADANISRAVGLIQNFKRVSANQSNEVFETINLLDTLNNIVEYIRPAIKKKVADIEVAGADHLTFVSCAGALTQIFTNLIMNSVIHGFENKSRESCRIKISFLSDNSVVTVKYSDNGKGMTEEEVQKLFQPFFTTKRDLGGSGLGAHIMYTHVTQTLNGQIICKSEPGKGAEFIIKIPMQPNA